MARLLGQPFNFDPGVGGGIPGTPGTRTGDRLGNPRPTPPDADPGRIATPRPAPPPPQIRAPLPAKPGVQRDPRLKSSSIAPRGSAPSPAPAGHGGGGGGEGGGGGFGGGFDFSQFEVDPQTLAPTPFLDSRIEALLQSLGLSPDEQAFSDRLRAMILAQLDQNSRIPQITDETLAPQQRAFTLEQQRAFEDFQRQQAATAARLGLSDSGAREVETEGFLQRQGEASGANAARLVANELDSRRSSLQGALGQAAQLSDADLTRNLQERLVLLQLEQGKALGVEDLALRRLLGQGSLSLDRELGLGGLNLQRELGLGQIGLQRELGLGELDLGHSQLAESARSSDLDRLLKQLGL